MARGGHLDLHVGRNGWWDHWLLILMLVAVTLLRWLLLMVLLLMLLLLLLVLLLRMRSDLRMVWGIRDCHRDRCLLWRHRRILLHLLSRLDFGLSHCGSGQFLVAALSAAFGSILDLGMGVALGESVSERRLKSLFAFEVSPCKRVGTMLYPSSCC